MADVNQAIDAITRVIDASNNKVLLVSGALAYQAYQSPKMIGSIEKALKRHLQFDIIVGPTYNEEASPFIFKKLGDFIHVAPEWPTSHFVVGDDKHIRYEKDHQYADGMPVADNMVGLNMPQIAEFLVPRFFKLKAHCKPYKKINPGS